MCRTLTPQPSIIIQRLGMSDLLLHKVNSFFKSMRISEFKCLKPEHLIIKRKPEDVKNYLKVCDEHAIKMMNILGHFLLLIKYSKMFKNTFHNWLWLSSGRTLQSSQLGPLKRWLARK